MNPEWADFKAQQHVKKIRKAKAGNRSQRDPQLKLNGKRSSTPLGMTMTKHAEPQTSNSRSGLVAVEVFDAGAGVEDDDAFAAVDLTGSAQRLQSGEACSAFRSDE